MKDEPLCIVNVQKLCEDLELDLIHCSSEEIPLYDSSINRPGLQLHGYYAYFDEKRIQLIGKVEISYLLSLDKEERERKIDEFFSHEFPCFIVSWDLAQWEWFVGAAKKYNRTLILSKYPTNTTFYRVFEYIDRKSAPSITVHAVFMDVHGVGVLIMGDSGIGKSETALELLQRGNCLIADDVVDIKKYQDRILFGTAPKLLRHYMEVRGIGIIDVLHLFGARSVKTSSQVELVIELQKWSTQHDYDRLGLDEETKDIMGVSVPMVRIPVATGRNLAVIIEAAAINSRMKAMGYHSAQVFCERVAQENLRLEEETKLEKNK